MTGLADLSDEDLLALYNSHLSAPQQPAAVTPPSGRIEDLSDEDLLKAHAAATQGKTASPIPVSAPPASDEAPLSDYERWRRDPKGYQAAMSAPHAPAESQVMGDQRFWKGLKGVPFAGAMVPQTPELTKYENESPTAMNLPYGLKVTNADLVGALGGTAALGPLAAAAPAAFGAGEAPIVGRTILSALSSGGIAGGDRLTRDLVAGTPGPEALRNAGLSGLVGAGIGGALTPVAAAGGAVVSPVAKALMRRFNPQGGTSLTGAAAKLSAEGEAAAKAAGLDPAKLSPEQAQQFANAVNPAEAAQAFGNQNEFGIESSLGQRLKDPQQLHAEEQMRRGLMGQPAKEMMTGFDTNQNAAVTQAARETIPGKLAPGVDAAAADRQSIGNTVQDALQGAKGAAKLRENAAWDGIGPLYASDAAKKTLPGYVQNAAETAGITIDPQLTPAAHKMVTMLQDYTSGQPLRNPYSILGEAPPVAPHMDELRRKLLSLSNSGSNPADSRAAQSLYKGYTEWSHDIASAPNGLASGDAADVARLTAARDITKQTRSLYAPTVRGTGTLTPSGKILDKAFSGETTPESVITNLVGTGPKGTVNDAQVEALKHVKSILAEPQGSVTAGPPANKNVWDSLRLAYWTNLTATPAGRQAAAGHISTNIEKAFNNQRSVLETLYSPKELAAMRSYQKALDSITYKPPNASGSSYGMQQTPKDSVAALLLETGRKMAGLDFSAPLHLARKLINPEGEAASAGAEAAKRAVNQSVAQKEPSPFLQQSVPYSSAIARALMTPQPSTSNQPSAR